MVRRVFVALLAAIVLVGCGGPSEAELQATVAAAVAATAQAQQVATSVAATQEAEAACGEKALTAYADAIERQIQRFEQQTGLAGSTPRASLGEPLQRLLDLQNEAQDTKAPECLKQYHEQVVSMMGLYRLAYQNFAAQGDETLTQASLQVGQETLATLKQGLGDIRKGVVPPTPVPVMTPTP